MAIKFPTIRKWASLVRDVGLILGVPVLIGIGSHLYQQQISALDAQNDLLKQELKTQSDNDAGEIQLLQQTQYPKVGELLDGQSKIAEAEKKQIEAQLADAKKFGDEKAAEVESTEGRLKAENDLLAEIERARKIIYHVHGPRIFGEHMPGITMAIPVYIDPADVTGTSLSGSSQVLPEQGASGNVSWKLTP